MRKRSEVLFSFLIVLILCAWAVSPAYAHALLAHADPAPNAILEKAPTQVKLEFTESVAPVLSSVHVYNAIGERVDLANVQVGVSGATIMTVSLPPLKDGVYTVSWKVTSLTDGHLTTGSYPFAVGKVSPTDLAAKPQTTNASLPVGALVAKWLMLISVAILVAEIPFQILVWRPATKLDLPYITHPVAWKIIYQCGLLGLFLGTGLSLLSQSGQMLGSLLAAPWSQENYQVLFESRLGLVWLIRLGLALICFWLSTGSQLSWKRYAALAVSLALLFTVSLTSHAATDPRSLLPLFSDWLHLIGMSFWFGGLAYFLFGLLALRKLESVIQTRLVSLTVQKFSVLALASVALIGVTGLYAASIRIGTLQALTTSLYGYSMLIKQGFVGMLMVIAAGNLLVISPRLNRNRISGTSNAGLVKRFTLMVFAESLLAVFLLLSVSYLTYLPPAKANPAEIGLSASVQADDLSMDLWVMPGVIGQNSFDLTLSVNGQPLLSAKEVLLRFTPLNKNIPPSEIALKSKGNGQYSASGANLSLPADWKVEAIVRRDQKFDVFASFQFALAPSGAGASPDSTPQIAGGLLILDGLFFALAMFSLAGKNILKLGVGVPLSLILVVGGAFLSIRPGAPAGQVNPIPASSQSIQAGAKVFANYCVACHGETGMGDGPLAKNLNPKPADLMAQGAPGVHTDEELFGWISNGFPGSAMPGFKTSLSETDRWNLVNFIRTLSGK
ncbi:MAG: copper resistance protein CopC [Chloroflexi bacterium]|nr:copper resistance protein CopC [Chloroflexota bacterium]